jgi:hypothetical protein
MSSDANPNSDTGEDAGPEQSGPKDSKESRGTEDSMERSKGDTPKCGTQVCGSRSETQLDGSQILLATKQTDRRLEHTKTGAKHTKNTSL